MAKIFWLIPQSPSAPAWDGTDTRRQRRSVRVNGRLLTVHVSFSLSLFYARCRESRERRPLFSQGWMVRRHSFFVNDGALSTPADKEDTSVVLAVHVAISKQGR